MKIKKLAFILAILLAVAALSACSNAGAITVGGEQLNFAKLDITDTYAGITPAQGNQILTVKYLTQSQSPDLTKISEAFFGQTPSTISDGTNSYPCKSIAFENSGGKIIVTLLFEVPSTLKSETKTLTLSGSTFAPIDLKL